MAPLLLLLLALMPISASGCDCRECGPKFNSGNFSMIMDRCIVDHSSLRLKNQPIHHQSKDSRHDCCGPLRQYGWPYTGAISPWSLLDAFKCPACETIIKMSGKVRMAAGYEVRDQIAAICDETILLASDCRQFLDKELEKIQDFLAQKWTPKAICRYMLKLCESTEPTHQSALMTPSADMPPLPNNFDLRNEMTMPAINKQISTSCYAHAVKYSLEAYALSKGLDPRNELSVQMIIDCTQTRHINRGKNIGGSVGLALRDIFAKGICERYEYSEGRQELETEKEETCRRPYIRNKKGIEACHWAKGLEFEMIESSEADFVAKIKRNIIHNKIPAIITINADHSFDTLKKGTIWSGPIGNVKTNCHSVDIIGWSSSAENEEEFFIIGNSYGKEWSDQGYGWLKPETIQEAYLIKAN